MLNKISSHKLNIFRNCGVATAYFVGGEFGLSLSCLSSGVLLFWPATGIAVAALLCWGMPCWMGIFLGALTLNLAASDFLLPTALGVAAGNTLGPILTASLFKRMTGFQKSFVGGREIAVFILIVSVSLFIASSIGVLAIWSSGMLSADLFFPMWLGWWLVEIAGVILFTPFLVDLAAHRIRLVPRKAGFGLESKLTLSVCIVLSWFIFGEVFSVTPIELSSTILLFAPLIWASFVSIIFPRRLLR